LLFDDLSTPVSTNDTPLEYKNGGIFVHKDWYVMATWGYWDLLLWPILKSVLTLVKRNKHENRVIFKAKHDVTLPIFKDTFEKVLMVESFYMN
jgi:hypothetical protein